MADRQRISSYLVYGISSGHEQVVVWDTVDIEVGRSKSQDVVLADPEVSRQHTLFHREGGRHTVQDRGTGLGTFVNGERISTERELQPGDVVRIGPLELKFGTTTKPIRPGPDLRYASELKASHLAVATGAGGRTVLGFDPDDEIPPSGTTAAPGPEPVKRAVSFDGSFDELDSDDPLGVEDYDAFVAENATVHDLEAACEVPPAPDRAQPPGASAPQADTSPPQTAAAATPAPAVPAATPAPPASAPDPQAATVAPASAGPPATEAATAKPLADTPPPPEARASCARILSLELEGPDEAVEAVLAFLRGKSIELPPLKIRVR